MEQEEFDIVDLIINTIEEEVEIPVFFMRCEEDLTNPYVIFSCTNEIDSDRFDNNFLSEYYNLDVTLWYTNPQDGCLYKKIKEALKNKGFKFKKCYDVIDENSNDTIGVDIYYGKLMTFSYKHFLF